MSFDFRRRSTGNLATPERNLEDDRPEVWPMTPDEAWDERPDFMVELIVREVEDYAYDFWDILRTSKHPAASVIRDRITRRVEEIER